MYRLFRIPTRVLITSLVAGLVLFITARQTYLAYYDVFFDGNEAHLMRGFGVYFAGLIGIVLVVFALAGSIIFYAGPWLWLVYQRGWNVGRLIYKRERCEHHWIYDPHNSAKRTCSKCQSFQTLRHNRFAGAGEAALNWRDQNFDELHYL